MFIPDECGCLACASCIFYIFTIHQDFSLQSLNSVNIQQFKGLKGIWFQDSPSKTVSQIGICGLLAVFNLNIITAD